MRLLISASLTYRAAVAVSAGPGWVWLVWARLGWLKPDLKQILKFI